MTTEEEFMEKQGGTLHIRLLMYYNQYTSTDERDNQKDTDVLQFEFENGVYVITYGDLKIKADEETLMFAEKHEIELKQPKTKKKNGNK